MFVLLQQIYEHTCTLLLQVNATSHDVICKQNKVMKSGWRFLQLQ